MKSAAGTTPAITEIAGCVMKMKMKLVIFWSAFAIAVVMAAIRVPFAHDTVKSVHLEKAGWTVPVLNEQMLPVQCAGLGRRGQWVCANFYYGSAAGTLNQQDVWGKHMGLNPCAYFRAHLRALEQTEYDSSLDWKDFTIGLAACETV